MANDGRIYDGHSYIFGQDSDTEAAALPSRVAAKAVNRIFRGGKNRTRPPFVHRPFVFDEQSMPYEFIVRYGNIQGAFSYRRKKPGREDGIVVSIAGRLFHLTIVNDSFHVKFICEGNDPKLLHCWMEQAEEFLYVQDGDKLPWFWDGLMPSSARRSRGPDDNEMPIGTIIRYIHGRMFVSNAFDQIAASDIMYGAGFTNSANVQKFTENQYWAEGGYFGAPMGFGQITGMLAMARQYRGGLRGQGELLVTHIDGAQSIEAGELRSNWKDQQVQSVTLTGRGCVSPHSLINVNNDAFFRSDDGISTYSAATQDQNAYSFRKISRAVNQWFDQDTPDLTQFTSSIYFDNRVLTTVSPFLSSPADDSFGSHRYFRGIISLDLDRAGSVPGDSDQNFDGLWTGIRPVVLVNGRIGNTVRGFAFSHDDDGENRMYEIMRRGGNDRIEDKPVKTKWFYHTKRFSWLDTRLSNEFEIKKLIGGDLWFSEVSDRVKFMVEYRADNNPIWRPLMPEKPFGTVIGSDWKFSQPRYGRFKFNTPSQEDCDKGLPFPPNHGAAFQIKVSGEGFSSIDRMRIAMPEKNDSSSAVGDCNKPDDDPKTILDGETDNDYSYSIASNR